MSFCIQSTSSDNVHTFGYHKCWVKPNTKLTDEIMFSSLFSFFQLLHEFFCSRFCNRSNMFMDFLLGHTNTIIRNSQSLSLFIYFYFDFKICIITKKTRISKSLESRFINCITRIRDKLSEKYFFIWIYWVREKFEYSPRFCLKIMLFRHRYIKLCCKFILST